MFTVSKFNVLRHILNTLELKENLRRNSLFCMVRILTQVDLLCFITVFYDESYSEGVFIESYELYG